MKKELLEFLKNEETENIRIAADKFNSVIVLINNPSFVKKEGWEVIKYFDCETLKEIGEIQYNFKHNNINKYIYLYNIKVYNKEDLSRGIGSYAIKFLEEIAYSRGFYGIEGKYYPKEPATGKQVQKFYTRNGYYIEYEDYSKIVYKYLKKEEDAQIKNSTTLDENGYKVYGPLKKINLSKETTLEK